MWVVCGTHIHIYGGRGGVRASRKSTKESWMSLLRCLVRVKVGIRVRVGVGVRLRLRLRGGVWVG